METSTVLFAFMLTLAAGLATGIGSAIAFLTRRTSPRFLAGSLGFSAGVMIYVSLIEIFAKSRAALTLEYGPKTGYLLAVAAFFGGVAFSAIIDRLIPSWENPHEPRNVDSASPPPEKLMRMGCFTALALAIHNFPEGLATFAAGLADPKIALPIATAIAIHNIPEGIAVSMPVFFATGSRKKAFILSFLSGLAEPLGALIGFFLLRAFMSEAVFGLLFGLVAGIMVFISIDELLPTAEEYGEHHLAIYGFIAGMAVMAVSLLLYV